MIDPTIKFVFVGTLNPLTRSPLDLLIFFEKLLNEKIFNEKIELHFYGDLSKCFTYFNKFNHLVNKNIFLPLASKLSVALLDIADLNNELFNWNIFPVGISISLAGKSIYIIRW